MKKSVVVIGIGEMGSVFARGLLRCGHPVYPVTRDTDMNSLAQELTEKGNEPELVLDAVAEKDLQYSLQQIPAAWKDRVALLQNELLPNDWAPHAFKQPTVISVWFEKKKGQDSKVLIASPAYGPKATLLCDALAALDIDCRIVASENELLDELILKNVYIVTTNVCGLVTGGDVKHLWENHQELARQVANEVMDIQEALTASKVDRGAMIDKMLDAFAGDWEHKCMGRSAPARLQRALASATELGVEVPAMRKISEQQ